MPRPLCAITALYAHSLHIQQGRRQPGRGPIQVDHTFNTVVAEAVDHRDRGTGLQPGSPIEIAMTPGGPGLLPSGMLRSQILPRKFDSGPALRHVLKGIRFTDGVARCARVYAPLLAARRTAWTEPQAASGSGADQTELPRWLGTTVVPDPEQAAAEEPRDAQAERS
jgi:hypothetical protein